MGNTRTTVKRDLQNIQRRGRIRQVVHGNKELVGQSHCPLSELGLR
jgi:DeoR/GlpR family transcriptional regulator of sugar metabolism